MATERLSMRSIKEVLRQKWVLKKSHREVAPSLGISAGAVGSVMVRTAELGLSWETVKECKCSPIPVVTARIATG